MKNIHRLAGLSLGGCVGLGAIGQHKVKNSANEYQYHAYSTANRQVNNNYCICYNLYRYFNYYIRYHFLHSLGLFTAQFSSYPMVTASLFILGQITFCGGGYLFAIFDEHEAKKYSILMPIGGFCFIFGWLSHIL